MLNNYKIKSLFYVLAVSELINDPPDESTFLGHPIKYSGAMKMPGPFVLSVNGLPLGFPEIQKAVEIYIGNVAKTKPVYCHVVGNEATVKFQDDKGTYNFFLNH